MWFHMFKLLNNQLIINIVEGFKYKLQDNLKIGELKLVWAVMG